jgi:hypothetical protein
VTPALDRLLEGAHVITFPKDAPSDLEELVSLRELPKGPSPMSRMLVNIDVDDLERGIRFYVDALGLRRRVLPADEVDARGGGARGLAPHTGCSGLALPLRRARGPGRRYHDHRDVHCPGEGTCRRRS